MGPQVPYFGLEVTSVRVSKLGWMILLGTPLPVCNIFLRFIPSAKPADLLIASMAIGIRAQPLLCCCQVPLITRPSGSLKTVFLVHTHSKTFNLDATGYETVLLINTTKSPSVQLSFFFNFLEDRSPFCVATETLVLDF